MNVEEPEIFHTKPSTPVSPVPTHFPLPSKFPILQKQIDPVFNQTSTHMASSDAASEAKPAESQAIPEDEIDAEGDSVDENDFSDPFEEADEPEKPESSSIPAVQKTDADDEYAMTFDSDGPESEAEASSVDDNAAPAQPTVSPETHIESSPNPVQSTETHTTSAVASVSHEPSPSVTATQMPSNNDAKSSSNGTSQAQASTTSAYEGIANGDIDIQQLLDNITANAETQSSKDGTTPAVPPTSATTASAIPVSGLPPKPAVLGTPAMHPAYAPQDDIRKYHAGPSFPAPPGTAYRAPGAPGAIVASSLPPPPSASFLGPPPGLTPPPGVVPSLPPPGRPEAGARGGHAHEDGHDEGEVQWGPDIQKLYEAFLADERHYVAEGTWDKFPVGSRLFIGNLPTEKVSKRDIFYLFYKYGRLAQISIKQAFGFVQYHDVDSCHNALVREQGQELRGRRMHLEISKPQKNTKNANKENNQNTRAQQGQQRSRSPEYGSRGGNRQDHYDGRQALSPRDNYRNGPVERGRDDQYRPGRGDTPPQGRGYGGRDDYRSHNGAGRGDFGRNRSRSPAYGDRRDSRDRYRERSPSPRSRAMNEDDSLGIPRRNARDVPDVQILLLDELDRNFVQWVEDQLRARGLRTDALFLSPRLPVDLVVKRQILEGVVAVVKLTRGNQQTGKIPLQVFDRSAGIGNVRFDEYVDLAPNIAAELVVREKSKAAPPQPAVQQPYGYPPYQPPAPIAAPPPAATPNLGNLVGSLDNATLQKLLSTISAPIPAAAPQQQNPVAAQHNGGIDLQAILGGLMGNQAQAPQQQQHQQNPQQFGQQGQYPAQQATQNLTALLAGVGGGQQTQQGGQDAAQVQNIMAQLARFRG